MSTKITVTVALILVAVMLSGCGTNPPKKQDEIINDAQKFEYFSSNGIEIYDIEIEKRQTDTGNKTDLIYAWFSAKNERIDCNVGLKLEYGLYDDGWYLERVEAYQSDLWTVKPISGVPREEADNVIQGRFNDAKYLSHTEDVENGYVQYVYEAQNSFPYLTEIHTIELDFLFSAEKATWNNTLNIVDTVEHWSVDGTWTYYFLPRRLSGPYPDPEITATISIDEFDGETLLGSYTITYKCNTAFQKNESISDSGSIAVERNREISRKIDYSNTGFRFDRNQGVLFKSFYEIRFDSKLIPMERN